jgi:hypothetical protein
MRVQFCFVYKRKDTPQMRAKAARKRTISCFAQIINGIHKNNSAPMTRNRKLCFRPSVLSHTEHRRFQAAGQAKAYGRWHIERTVENRLAFRFKGKIYLDETLIILSPERAALLFRPLALR